MKENLTAWMKSTRSIAVIMCLVLVFVIVIGSLLGGQLPTEVLTFVAGVIGAIVTAYFGKRDDPEDRNLPKG